MGGDHTLDKGIASAIGQRVSKNFGNVFDFHYDRAGHLLAERVGTSAYFSQYVWLDDLPLAFISFGSIDTIHTDHLGTPQKMTDGSQAIVWDGAASDPFMLGQLPGSPMNLRFPGQYFDSETGLHHNGLRDYDPTIGRYIESDPIGLAGGINTYAYVGGNPLIYIDPAGLSPPQTFSERLVCQEFPWTCGSPVPFYGSLSTGGGQGQSDEPNAQACKREPCPTCQPYPKDTIGFLGPHTTHDHFPIGRPHLNLFEVNQNPIDCSCHWNNATPPVVSPPPQVGWVDLNNGFPELSGPTR